MASYTFHYYCGAADVAIVNGTTQLLDDNGLRGFGVPRMELAMQRAPYMDGANLLGEYQTAPTALLTVQKRWPLAQVYMGPREMSIAIICKEAALTTLQTTLKAIIDETTPHLRLAFGVGPYLLITPPAGTPTYYIECWLAEMSDPVYLNYRGAARIILTFVAPTPYFHQEFGVAGNYTDMDANPDSITNSGQAPLWPDIWVSGSASTTIVGLHLTNVTTGKIWSTTQTIAVGITKKIRVNMLTGEASYTTDGGTSYSDIISKMDTDAEFWSMPVGANSIQWSSTSGTPSTVRIYHAWNYLRIL